MKPLHEVGPVWTAVKMSPDTNVFLRVLVRDDKAQAAAAEKVLMSASIVVISLPVLCEFVWALRSVYRYKRAQVKAALLNLLAIQNMQFEELAVSAGLAALAAGGDFADGVIAYEGRRLGGTIFVSFDRKAVALLKAQGHEAELIPATPPPS